MFFHNVKVDRITEAQIVAARKIIPSLDISPVTSVEEALLVAVKKTTPQLDRYEYVDGNRELVVITNGSVRNGKDRRAVNFVCETDEGWFFNLAVLGD